MKTSSFFALAALVSGAGALAAKLRRGGDMGAAAAASGSSEGALASLARLALHPELVATLLGEVEDAWVQGRLAVLRGDTKDDIAREEAMTSCKKVATSIVMGSDGLFDKAKTYMTEVCSKFNGAKGNHSMCQKFGQNIVGAMIGDPEYNREELNLTAPCASFYDSAVSAVALDAEKEEEKEDEERKKVASQTRDDAVQMKANDRMEIVAEEKMREVASTDNTASNASVATAAAKVDNATAKVDNATANATVKAAPSTTMSPTRARLQETIRKTQAAIASHERALAGTNVTRTRLIVAGANASNSTNVSSSKTNKSA